MAYEIEKKLIGAQAVTLVKSGMKIGIGTGSTVAPFIQSLISRVEKEKLFIQCVATSNQSKSMIQGIFPLLNESLDVPLDISFDGADHFDPKSFTSIKGGGGALLREKLVAIHSKVNVVLIDSSKIAHPFKHVKVPIEIIPFGVKATLERLKELGYGGSLRYLGANPYLTDNHNYIFDIFYSGIIYDPISEHFKLKQISGIVETGFFFKYAQYAFVGYPDQTVQLLEQ